MVGATGCRSLQDDLRESRVILYPVLKAGDVVEAVGFKTIGGGLRDLGSIDHSSLSRPGLIETTLSSEERATVEAIAIELPPSVLDLPEGYGFGSGNGVVAEESIPILLRVEQMAHVGFRWYLSPDQPSIARAMPGGVIVIDPDQLSELRVGVQLFVLLHEAGHHLQGHLSPAVERQAPDDRSESEYEFEADLFAARTMLAEGFYYHEVLYGALAAFRYIEKRVQLVPSGTERVARLREELSNP